MCFSVKEEFIDDESSDEAQAQKLAEETPSPHLQDHQYGQTPCYQVTRKLPMQPPPRTEVFKTPRKQTENKKINLYYHFLLLFHVSFVDLSSSGQKKTEFRSGNDRS